MDKFTFAQLHMGGEVRITLFADGLPLAEEAAKAAYARYAELEDVFSDYRPTSELMRLCSRAGGGPVEVSQELFEVLDASFKVSRASDGAFDVTASPIVRLWREARRTGKMPEAHQRIAALALVGWHHVQLDARRQTVTLELPGMQLDLGGIAKGYANDQAIQVLTNQGITKAMVEAGGDIGVSDPPPGAQGWVIKVRGDGDAHYLSNASISTSGDTEQFVEIEGVRYSHVVDPRTGLGVTSRVQATVIAPSGLTTDPWATALCVDPVLRVTQFANSKVITVN